MENTQDFIKTYEKFHYFHGHNEKELHVYMIGYHNFKYVRSEYFARQQFCHTLHFVISGKGHLMVNGEKFAVNAHDIFYLDDRCTFSYYSDEKQPWEYCFFELTGSMCETYAKMLGFSYETPVKPCPNPQSILTALRSCFQDDDFKPSYFMAVSLLNLIFDSVAMTENTSRNFGVNLIQEAKDFINVYYASPAFNLDFLCKAIHISHSHLCRLFKQKENFTPIQYVNQVKMQHAKELLLATEYSTYEIAIKCGFDEYEYFLRLFKKMFDMTPTDFRNSFKKAPPPHPEP